MSSEKFHTVGRIYFLAARRLRLVKIGFSTDLERRVRDLKRVIPVDLRLLGSIPGRLCDEEVLHEHLSAFRVRGEWFRAADVRSMIDQLLAMDSEKVVAHIQSIRRARSESVFESNEGTS